MFEIRLGPCDRDWLVYRDGRLWSPVGFRSEWEAIGAVRRVDPAAADELEALHRSAD